MTVSLSRKFRWSFVTLFALLAISIFCLESIGVEAGVQLSAIMILFLVYMVWMFKLKCRLCGKYVYEGIGKNTIGNPYAFLLLKGRCPNCNN